MINDVRAVYNQLFQAERASLSYPSVTPNFFFLGLTQQRVCYPLRCDENAFHQTSIFLSQFYVLLEVRAEDIRWLIRWVPLPVPAASLFSAVLLGFPTTPRGGGTSLAASRNSAVLICCLISFWIHLVFLCTITTF